MRILVPRLYLTTRWVTCYCRDSAALFRLQNDWLITRRKKSLITCAGSDVLTGGLADRPGLSHTYSKDAQQLCWRACERKSIVSADRRSRYGRRLAKSTSASGRGLDDVTLIRPTATSSVATPVTMTTAAAFRRRRQILLITLSCRRLASSVAASEVQINITDHDAWLDDKRLYILCTYFTNWQIV